MGFVILAVARFQLSKLLIPYGYFRVTMKAGLEAVVHATSVVVSNVMLLTMLTQAGNVQCLKTVFQT